MSTDTPHMLVFPFPAQGHIFPLLDLIHQLALKGLTLTILSTPKNLPTVTPLLTLHPSINTLILPLPEHPELPVGAENLKDVGIKGLYPIVNALGKLYDPLLDWCKANPSPPTAILSDVFLGWTTGLAKQLNIPRITFYGCTAFLACLYDYCWPNIETVCDQEVLEIPDLPRSQMFLKKNLPWSVRRFVRSDPDSEFLRDCMMANASSWGYVFNTFEALEGEYVQCLMKQMGHDRVYQVGPLSLIGPSSSGRGDMYSNSCANAISWLDGYPDGSVLYVCFGSQKLLNNKQMEALAAALDKSGARFLWAVKTSDQEGYGIVPDGFEDRVIGRGFVIKGWVPQVSILSHSAVSGFLSHCGWNSVLEAIVAGVMILAWPMEADQFVNARLLVDHMGVAVGVCEGADAVPDSTELSKVIAESMKGGIPEKVKAKKLKDEALEAAKNGGSSLQDLVRLVHDLKHLQVRRT